MMPAISDQDMTAMMADESRVSVLLVLVGNVYHLNCMMQGLGV